MLFFATVLFLIAQCLLSTTAQQDRSWNHIRSVYQHQSLSKCLDSGDFTCVKAKLIMNLNKVLQARQFHLFEGISVEKIPQKSSKVDYGRALTNNELDFTTIPNDHVDTRLDQLLLAGISRLFQNRAIKLAFVPGYALSISRNTEEGGRINVEVERDDSNLISQGRGEKAKIGGIFMMGFMAKAAFAVLAIAALKLLTFKALLVGKISLVLSGLQLVKNMMSTGHESSSHVVYSHRRSTGRNFQDNDYSEDSQNVPYNAYQFQQSTS